MGEIKKIYWDACIWIGLIKQEAERFDICSAYIELAKQGKVEIWTSSLTLAEVYKTRCDGEYETILSSQDVPFEDYIEQEFIREVNLTHEIGTAARRLLRKFSKIKKPTDGVHVATAAMFDVDEFHTYDGDNLLPCDGLIETSGGRFLKICIPTMPDIEPEIQAEQKSIDAKSLSFEFPETEKSDGSTFDHAEVAEPNDALEDADQEGSSENSDIVSDKSHKEDPASSD